MTWFRLRGDRLKFADSAPQNYMAFHRSKGIQTNALSGFGLSARKALVE